MTSARHARLTAALGVLSLAVALAVTGCGASADVLADNPANGAADTPTVVGPGTSIAKESMIDPAWPWPAAVPRPPGVTYEFTAANPIGDGGLWKVDFPVANLDVAQAFANELESAGWSFLGDSAGLIEDGTASWVLSRDGLLGTLATEDANASPIVISFTLMGTLD
jgi:hypothetical protein